MTRSEPVLDPDTERQLEEFFGKALSEEELRFFATCEQHCGKLTLANRRPREGVGLEGKGADETQAPGVH